jgi:hypothetical protein
MFRMGEIAFRLAYPCQGNLKRYSWWGQVSGWT